MLGTPLDWTIGQFNRGTQKLRLRILDLQALADERIKYDDQRVKNVESNILMTIKDVFGEDSDEYRASRNFTIMTGGFNRQPILQRGQFNHERQRKFESCIPNAISRINNLVSRRQEKLLEAQTCPTCDRAYFDSRIVYCLDDGSRLVSSSYEPEAETLIRPSSD